MDKIIFKEEDWEQMLNWVRCGQFMGRTVQSWPQPIIGILLS